MNRNINQSDLKLLWYRSGGRCAICRKELSLVPNGGIIGEMAHIVAHSDDGPRADKEFPKSNRNLYDNLILLCPTHHAEIDRNESEWPIERILGIKKQHENWVHAALSAPIANSTSSTKCLFVFSGPSGAGKDVLINRLIRRLEAGGYLATNLRRFTTREPRPDEIADTPFTYLSHQEFNNKVKLKKIGCVHTSLGHTYGCDANFAEDTPAKTAIFYSMRLYNFLPELKKEAENFGINVRNILIIADEDSIKARILMRSTSAKDKLARIETSLGDLSWLNSHEDFKDNFFDKIVKNSDSSKLRDVEENLYKYVLYTIDEVTELIEWWSSRTIGCR